MMSLHIPKSGLQWYSRATRSCAIYSVDILHRRIGTLTFAMTGRNAQRQLTMTLTGNGHLLNYAMKLRI